jgi:hypothetical protein
MSPLSFLNLPTFGIKYITIYIKTLLYKVCNIFTLGSVHLQEVFKTAIFEFTDTEIIKIHFILNLNFTTNILVYGIYTSMITQLNNKNVIVHELFGQPSYVKGLFEFINH